MIKTTCLCGQSISVGEDAAGQSYPCQCGQTCRFITAENPLPAGSGDGDFDSRLVIIDGPDNVNIPMLLGGVLDIEIGKLPEKHLQLAGGASVSRNHAKLSRLDFGPSRWMLHDLNSKNGTFLNGQRITEPAELKEGDQITIGDDTLRYGVESAPAPAPAAAAAVVAKPGGPVCPSCQKVLARNAKICTDCGIHVATGKPLVISKGLDEDALAIRADTWIRILSWVIPFGLFPIASEGFGTRKPIAIWTIAIITLIASVSFWVASFRGRDLEEIGPTTLNMMLWGGSEQVTRDYMEQTRGDLRKRMEAIQQRVRPGQRVRPEEAERMRDEVRQVAASARANRALERSAEAVEAGARFRWHQLLTHALLHGGLMHIAGNFLFLLVFGLRVNELIGNLRFSILYPLLAVAAAWAHMYTIRLEPLQAMLGASGAIMGLAGMYFVLFPVQKVHMAIWFRGGWLTRWQCFYKLWQMRGFWLLILWIGFNDVLPVALASRGTVAHAAHLGGFTSGMMVALLLLVIRQVNARGSDILSVMLGRRAWAIIGKPNQWKDPEPIESLAAKTISLNYPA